jgi:hypothetical protein
VADKQTAEDVIREALKEAYVVLVTLGKHCESVSELMGMIALAIGDENNPGNDAQLRLLSKLIKGK